MRFVETLIRSLESSPDRVVCEQMGSATRTWTAGQILGMAASIQEQLDAHTYPGEAVALAMSNSASWMASDLALLASGLVSIPVPLSFSHDQIRHLTARAKICLTDAVGHNQLLKLGTDIPSPVLLDGRRPAGSLKVRDSAWIDDVCKVIHTSGTTGSPKGVRIRESALAQVAGSLAKAIPSGTFERYTSLVPLSLLIEQICALYLPMLDGGRTVFGGYTHCHLGESGGTAQMAMDLVRASRPTALVLPPVLVAQILSYCERNRSLDAPSRNMALFGSEKAPFLACGGAPTPPTDILRLDAIHDLRVHEGYGLSENTSVASFNAPDSWEPFTVGKVLPHLEARTNSDGEILLRGASLFAGYQGRDPSELHLDEDGWLATGDLGEVLPSGHIRITGRKRDIIILSNSRNIHPASVEARFLGIPGVRRVAVVGEGRSGLEGVFLISPDARPDIVERRIRETETARSSSLERLTKLHLAIETPELVGELFTVTGRPRRDAIGEWLESKTSTMETATACE